MINKRRTTGGRKPFRPPSSSVSSHRIGAGTSGVVNHALHDHASHFIPPAVWILSLVVGIALHMYATTVGSLIGAVTLLLIATAGVAYTVWATCQDRDATSRWHGMVTVVLGGLWLVLCTVTGFITFHGNDRGGWDVVAHGPTIGIWGIGGLALWATWGARIQAKNRAAEVAELMASMTPEPTAMDHAGLPGATWHVTQVDQWRSEGWIYLAPGQTYHDVSSKLDAIASALRLPPSSVFAHQPKGTKDCRRVAVTVLHDDPLQEFRPWPGLTVKVGAAA